MNDFWSHLDHLIASHKIVIDRPAGSHHPRYAAIVYPLDYGYLEGTTSADGGGIDLWVGSQPERALTAIVMTIDLDKRDSEIKLLLGCTPTEQQTILSFLNDGESMRAALVRRPAPAAGD